MIIKIEIRFKQKLIVKILEAQITTLMVAATAISTIIEA